MNEFFGYLTNSSANYISGVVFIIAIIGPTCTLFLYNILNDTMKAYYRHIITLLTMFIFLFTMTTLTVDKALTQMNLSTSEKVEVIHNKFKVYNSKGHVVFVKEDKAYEFSFKVEDDTVKLKELNSKQRFKLTVDEFETLTGVETTIHSRN